MFSGNTATITPCRRIADTIPNRRNCNKLGPEMSKPQKMFNSFSSALWDTDLVASRLILAFGELCWAAMLLWPGDSFARPAYGYMAQVAGETVWGLVFLLSALTQVNIVLLDDLHGRFARYFACWNAALWLFPVWAVISSVYPPPAEVAGDLALAAAAVWIWLRPYILARGYYHATRSA